MTETYTEAQATDEAVLLFVRKMRRMHPDVFAEVWSKIPEGAQEAIWATERRADRERDANGISQDRWPIEPADQVKRWI
jgi:hypothetical protein